MVSQREEIHMDIQQDTPVIVHYDIHISALLETVWNLQTNVAAWPIWQPEVDAASIDGPFAVGTIFHWQTKGLHIASTIGEIVPQRRIVWSGPARGIEAVHLWTFTPNEHGVYVDTEESWDGESVRSQSEAMKQALGQSLEAWIRELKQTAEASMQHQ